MRDFTIIYKILKILDTYNGREDFDCYLISAKALQCDYSAWEQIMIELQRNDFIRGLVYTQTLSDKFPHIVEPIHPQITLKGMEFLETNSLMHKAGTLLKTVGEIL